MAAERTVTVIGTNLFEVAASELGDATAWDLIAAANDLSDPFIDVITTLVVPASTSS